MESESKFTAGDLVFFWGEKWDEDGKLKEGVDCFCLLSLPTDPDDGSDGISVKSMTFALVLDPKYSIRLVATWTTMVKVLDEQGRILLVREKDLSLEQCID